MTEILKPFCVEYRGTRYPFSEDEVEHACELALRVYANAISQWKELPFAKRVFMDLKQTFGLAPGNFWKSVHESAAAAALIVTGRTPVVKLGALEGIENAMNELQLFGVRRENITAALSLKQLDVNEKDVEVLKTFHHEKLAQVFESLLPYKPESPRSSQNGDQPEP